MKGRRVCARLSANKLQRRNLYAFVIPMRLVFWRIAVSYLWSKRLYSHPHVIFGCLFARQCYLHISVKKYCLITKIGQR